MARTAARLRLDLARLLERRTRLNGRIKLIEEKILAAVDRESRGRSARRLARARNSASI
jgi:hypothetical protein